MRWAKRQKNQTKTRLAFNNWNKSYLSANKHKRYHFLISRISALYFHKPLTKSANSKTSSKLSKPNPSPSNEHPPHLFAICYSYTFYPYLFQLSYHTYWLLSHHPYQSINPKLMPKSIILFSLALFYCRQFILAEKEIAVLVYFLIDEK